MVTYHIDMVMLDIDLGCGLMISEMTVLIWSSSISTWDILTVWSLSDLGDREVHYGQSGRTLPGAMTISSRNTPSDFFNPNIKAR